MNLIQWNAYRSPKWVSDVFLTHTEIWGFWSQATASQEWEKCTSWNLYLDSTTVTPDSVSLVVSQEFILFLWVQGAAQSSSLGATENQVCILFSFIKDKEVSMQKISLLNESYISEREQQQNALLLLGITVLIEFYLP